MVPFAPGVLCLGGGKAPKHRCPDLLVGESRKVPSWQRCSPKIGWKGRSKMRGGQQFLAGRIFLGWEEYFCGGGDVSGGLCCNGCVTAVGHQRKNEW